MARRKNFKPVQFDSEPKPKFRFSIKNLLIIWAVVFAGFLATYMILSSYSDSFVKTNTSENETTITNETQEATAPEGEYINPVPKTKDMQGNIYLSECDFVGDSILGGLNAYDYVKKDSVMAGESYTLNGVESSGVTIAKNNIYLLMGYSELSTEKTDDVIDKYSGVIDFFKQNFSGKVIYILSIPPSTEDTTGVQNKVIDDFNTKLLKLATDKNLPYVDINTELKDNSGYLNENYAGDESGENGYFLSKKGYDVMVDYILSHTVQ